MPGSLRTNAAGDCNSYASVARRTSYGFDTSDRPSARPQFSHASSDLVALLQQPEVRAPVLVQRHNLSVEHRGPVVQQIDVVEPAVFILQPAKQLRAAPVAGTAEMHHQPIQSRAPRRRCSAQIDNDYHVPYVAPRLAAEEEDLWPTC
ncbi:hypothetical protein [Lentzea sp. E54]|uniref:hypothetical protein n=1 Tax=Lentzea xerophila TaxID=3435883 RepID=UPI003DA6483D